MNMRADVQTVVGPDRRTRTSRIERCTDAFRLGRAMHPRHSAIGIPLVSQPPYGLRPVATNADGEIDLLWNPLWIIGGYIAANVAALLVLSFWTGIFDDSGLGVRLLASIGLWVGFLGAPLLAARTQGTSDLGRDFGFRMSWSDVPVGLVSGAVLQLAVLPVVYWVLQLVTGPLDVDGPAKDLAAEVDGPASWIAIALVIGVGAPIFEELFFRGLLQSTVAARWGVVWGVLVSSALFAATHFQPVQFVGLFIAGATWAGLRASTRRLGPAIFSHMAFNLTSVAVLAAT